MIELPVVWIIVALFILLAVWAEGVISGKADLPMWIDRFHGRYPNTYKLLLLLTIIFWPVTLVVIILCAMSYLIWSFCLIFYKSFLEIYDMVSRK